MCSVALAGSDNILLLWAFGSRLHLSSVFLVRPCLYPLCIVVSYVWISMRYSRLLEESCFPNRKADYFWMLLLSSIMLLVRVSSCLCHHLLTFRVRIVNIPARQSPLPILILGVRSNLHLVQTASFNADVSNGRVHNNSTLSAHCAGWVLLGSQRYLESGCRRLGWMCRGPSWLVPSGRLGKGARGW